METKGKYKITKFRQIPPDDRGILEPHIYEGFVKDIPTTLGKKESYKVTWDRFGRCSNWAREDCFIDVENLK